MGLIARIFASPKAIADAGKAIASGVDKAWFTNEEARELYAKLWQAAVPSALSRRLIACALVGTFCVLVLFSVVLYAVGLRDPAEFTFRVLVEVLLQPVNIIVGFYFLTQIVGTYRTRDGGKSGGS